MESATLAKASGRYDELVALTTVASDPIRDATLLAIQVAVALAA